MNSRKACAQALTVGVLLALGLSPAACAQSKTTKPASPTVGELAANPRKFVEAPLVVRGTLENSGKNYFRDFHLTLRNAEGKSFDVEPWLPKEMPPSPPGMSGARPETLTKYLGHTVELSGTVRKKEATGSEETFLFVVKSAKIIE
jgi:hypothetical protein